MSSPEIPLLSKMYFFSHHICRTSYLSHMIAQFHQMLIITINSTTPTCQKFALSHNQLPMSTSPSMSQSFQIHRGHCSFTPNSEGLFQCPCSHHKGSNKKYRTVADLTSHLKTVQKILSSSITGEFTYLSPYLLESSAMGQYSLVINTEYKLLICLSCGLAVLPSQLKTLLSSQHSIRLPVKDQSPIANLLSITQVDPALIQYSHTHIFPLPVLTVLCQAPCARTSFANLYGFGFLTNSMY